MGRLEEIEARVRAARPGPWVHKSYDWDGGRSAGNIEGPRDPEHGEEIVDLGCGCCPQNGNLVADFDFIAHAREDIPWLLEYVKTLETTIQGWRLAADGGPVRLAADGGPVA